LTINRRTIVLDDFFLRGGTGGNKDGQYSGDHPWLY
jgi:hypothetical protein